MPAIKWQRLIVLVGRKRKAKKKWRGMAGSEWTILPQFTITRKLIL